jgi:type III secretion system YscJ/HrcJ family lipoprotein
VAEPLIRSTIPMKSSLLKRALVVLTSGWIAAACSVPVATNLGEHDANNVVVALENASIVGEKSPDPAVEGGWQVWVSEADASAAIGVLTRENLPPPTSPGVLDALGDGSMVPSRASEHARFIAGTAGDLERSLRSVEGVLSTRVHLAVPTKDPLAIDDQRTAPSASVLVKYRGETPPLTEDDVKRLIAGAVTGLSAEDVSVVAQQIAAPPPTPDQQLVRLGPVTTTRASLGAFKTMLGVGAALNVLLIGAVLLLWTRLRQTRTPNDLGALSQARVQAKT